MAFVLPDISIPDIIWLTTELTVTVADVLRPVLTKVAVSCANGKLSVLTAPPAETAQALSLQFPPAAWFQYTVLGVLNVMPLQPLRSPILVPLMGAALPMT